MKDNVSSGPPSYDNATPRYEITWPGGVYNDDACLSMYNGAKLVSARKATAEEVIEWRRIERHDALIRAIDQLALEARYLREELASRR